MSSQHTVNVPVEQLADHALGVLLSMPTKDRDGKWHWNTGWDSAYDDDLLFDLEKIPYGVVAAESDGYLVTFYGSYSTYACTGEIPAGPNHGYGPINPPEPIVEEVDVEFELLLDMSDEGKAWITMETEGELP